MKQLMMMFFVVVCLGVIACHEEDAGYYTGENYIQFYSTYPNASSDITSVWIGTTQAGIGYSWPHVGPNKNRDTVYYRLQAVGELSDKVREVRFEQYFEVGDELQAEPGVDYVPFDDPELLKHYVLLPDSAFVNVPVVFLYNENKTTDKTDNKPLFLYFRLVVTDDFQLGSPHFQNGVCKFDNMLY